MKGEGSILAKIFATGFDAGELHDLALCAGWTLVIQAASEGAQSESYLHRKAAAQRAMEALRRLLGDGYMAKLRREIEVHPDDCIPDRPDTKPMER